MLACDPERPVSTSNEISYNSAISTCEKDQQCSETHCAAGKQRNGSDDLKPAGAKACASPTTRIKPKDVKGELAAPETMDLKPVNVKVVPAAQNTIEYAEMKMTEKLENKHDCFFEYNALEDDNEFVDAGGILNVSEQDLSLIHI